MKVIIPVAGKATRMRPHTHTKIKPFITVAGKPSLGYIMDELKKFVENAKKAIDSDCEKEASELTAQLLKENNKETLAQVFTDNRYTKKDNVYFSQQYLKVLTRQEFMFNEW